MDSFLQKFSGKKAFVPLAVGVCLFALTSCSTADPPQDQAVDQSGSPVEWATYDDAGANGSGDALLSGQLVLQGGCLYIKGGKGMLELPVFPRSTTSFTEDTLTFTDFSGEEVSARLNSEVAFGGGVIDKEHMSFATVPEACTAKVFQVFSVES